MPAAFTGSTMRSERWSSTTTSMTLSRCSPGWPTLTPAHFSIEQRKVLRAAAIAYRRAYRAGASQGECHDAALREYRRVCSDAPADQLAASQDLNRMVAAAINADPQWFCLSVNWA